MRKKPLASLKKTGEFSRVFKKGRPVSGNLFVVHACPNDSGVPRLGLVVSKKVGGAVSRNRIRRLIKEACRQMDVCFGGFDIVVQSRVHAAEALKHDGFRQASGELMSAFLQLGLVEIKQ